MGLTCSKTFVIDNTILGQGPSVLIISNFLTLSRDDINILYAQFCKYDIREENAISVGTYLETNDVEKHWIGDMMRNDIGKRDNSLINFEEYVIAMWNFCTATNALLARSIFSNFDPRGRGVIKEEDMNHMIEIVWGKRQERHFHEALKTVHNKSHMDGLVLSEFVAMVHFSPAMLFAVTELQTHIRIATLGMARWCKLTENREYKFKLTSVAEILSCFEGNSGLKTKEKSFLGTGNRNGGGGGGGATKAAQDNGYIVRDVNPEEHQHVQYKTPAVHKSRLAIPINTNSHHTNSSHTTHSNNNESNSHHQHHHGGAISNPPSARRPSHSDVPPVHPAVHHANNNHHNVEITSQDIHQIQQTVQHIISLQHVSGGSGDSNENSHKNNNNNNNSHSNSHSNSNTHSHHQLPLHHANSPSSKVPHGILNLQSNGIDYTSLDFLAGNHLDLVPHPVNTALANNNHPPHHGTNTSTPATPSGGGGGHHHGQHPPHGNHHGVSNAHSKAASPLVTPRRDHDSHNHHNNMNNHNHHHQTPHKTKPESHSNSRSNSSKIHAGVH